MQTDPSVVDLSHYQATPDFAAMHAGGLIGVILKATEGTGYVDPTFKSRRQAASAAGLLTASYHYLKIGDVDEQIGHYLDTVRPVAGERVVIDFEDGGLELGDLEDAVQALIDANLNLQITVYGGGLLKEQLGQASQFLAENTSLWLAQYTAGTPSWPKSTWRYWSLWQYSDAGSVPGLAGDVDLNRFNGDDDALRAWLAPASGGKPAVPRLELTLSAETEVSIAIRAGANVKLSLA